MRIEREAQDLADNLGVRIFSADIIYHLFDNFMKYREVCVLRCLMYKHGNDCIYVILDCICIIIVFFLF